MFLPWITRYILSVQEVQRKCRSGGLEWDRQVDWKWHRDKYVEMSRRRVGLQAKDRVRVIRNGG